MNKVLIILALLTTASFGFYLKHPLRILSRIPSHFTALPVIHNDDDGSEKRMWVVKGKSADKYDQTIQIQSYPVSKETVEMQAAGIKLALEKEGCTAQETQSTAPISDQISPTPAGQTNERIIAFSCPTTQNAGIHRILSGSGPFGGAIFIVSYFVQTDVPNCPTMEEIEKRVTDFTVVTDEIPRSVPKKK